MAKDDSTIRHLLKLPFSLKIRLMKIAHDRSLKEGKTIRVNKAMSDALEKYADEYEKNENDS